MMPWEDGRWGQDEGASDAPSEREVLLGAMATLALAAVGAVAVVIVALWWCWLWWRG
jgi:hypothetical protein